MRTWFGYDETGVLRSVEVKGRGGWPPDFDFRTAAEKNIVDLRNERAKQGITSFIPYDCPCLPSVSSCACHNAAYGGSYVENGQLVPKPEVLLHVNGTSGQGELGNILYDGLVEFFLTGPVPDGATVDLIVAGMAKTPDHLTLSFTGGKTPVETRDLRTFGAFAMIYGRGKYVRPVRAVMVR